MIPLKEGRAVEIWASYVTSKVTTLFPQSAVWLKRALLRLTGVPGERVFDTARFRGRPNRVLAH